MRWPERLRGAARAAAMAAATIPCCVVLAVRLLKAGRSRQSRGRARARSLRLWARWMARIMGIHVTARGTPPRPPFLLVSNHLGYADIVLLASRLDCLFVSRGDLAGWPVLGPLARAVGTRFIDRARRADIPRALAELKESLGDGLGVVLFPEGTSSSGDTILPFKSPLLEAAAEAEIPVCCAAIAYTTGPGDLPARDAVCWWGDATFLPHLWGMLGLRRIDAALVFGEEPIVGSERKLLARALHDGVEQLQVEARRGGPAA